MSEIAFGPFSLDTSATRLVRNGREVRLRPQAFHALRVLARQSGRCLTYDELMAYAWRGVVVSPHTIDVTVAEVRKALEEYGSWVRHRPGQGYTLEVPPSSDRIRLGWHLWNLRTKDGFEKALQCFQEAEAQAPDDFRAPEGQAMSCVMLAAYGIRPGRELLPAFDEALQRAERLIGRTPELRCARAHGLHMLEHRLDEAESEFRKALEGRPTLATAHLGLTTLYATIGRLDDALLSIGRARACDPLLPALPATEVSVRIWRREFDLAVRLGAKAVELQPYVVLGRVYYGQALELSGRLDEALAEFRDASILFRDVPWVRAFEGGCLARMGRRSEARAILDELESRRRTDYVDSYAMAVFRKALGDSDRAFEELHRAVEENCVSLYAIDVDPKADAFRSDRRFARVRNKIRGSRRPARTLTRH
jgi:DNA-binding winged helix-turn-helix (wHTH) protein